MTPVTRADPVTFALLVARTAHPQMRFGQFAVACSESSAGRPFHACEDAALLSIALGRTSEPLVRGCIERGLAAIRSDCKIAPTRLELERLDSTSRRLLVALSRVRSGSEGHAPLALLLDRLSYLNPRSTCLGVYALEDAELLDAARVHFRCLRRRAAQRHARFHDPEWPHNVPACAAPSPWHHFVAFAQSATRSLGP